MPAKPAWWPKLDSVIHQLRQSPRPFVDRADLELLLGVGRRRAQQILSQCVTDRVGASGVAGRDALIAHLERMGRGEAAYYERRRREKVAAFLEQSQRQHTLRVQAPAAIVHQRFEGLPPGVHLEPGRIQVDFEQPEQALEKLLALAMAIGNDFDSFHRMTQLDENQSAPGMLED